MDFKDITAAQKQEYDKVVNHPLQTYAWGEFREKTGIRVIRKGFYNKDKIETGFQLTLHRVPRTPFSIGYLPKGDLPTKDMLEELRKIGRENKCLFIQLEPNVLKSQISNLKSQNNWILDIGHWKLFSSVRPLFTKYTFILDLTKSEDELLKNMHSKTRYNIRVAEKHGVEIVEDNSSEGFEKYLQLTEETTKRQRFYAHTQEYHRLLWETLGTKNLKTKNSNELTAHLFLATYKQKTLAAWILFVFKDTLYYPYGASSNEHRETMASNLMMWEAIKFGKSLGLKKFDMWGALEPNPDPKDPWFGFHRFKMGYGPVLTEFIGSFDFVIYPNLYKLFKIADKARWLYLRVKR